MSSSIYCVGKKVGQQMVMTVCEKGDEKEPAKRVNIVSLKMVREGKGDSVA